jgi:hypothetical protein
MSRDSGRRRVIPGRRYPPGRRTNHLAATAASAAATVVLAASFLPWARSGSAETLRRHGFVGMVADCIAEEVHWMGLTDEELLGLERDDPDVWNQLSDDVIAQIDDITEYCETRGP